MKKISRQFSALALGLISVVALLLATGLVVYTDTAPDNATQPALTSPLPRDVETIDSAAPVPLAAPAPVNSLAVLGGSILIVITFVLVWFLVFRPQNAPASTSK